jgi:predicted nucleic acid-binding protein
MRESIVSDTTALIILGKLDRFDLLGNIFQKIYIPKSVFSELSQKDDGIEKMIKKKQTFLYQRDN